MMAICLHPFVIGVSHRIWVLESALDEARRIAERIKTETGREVPIVPFASVAYAGRLGRGVMPEDQWDRYAKALGTVDGYVLWMSVGDASESDRYVGVLDAYLGRGSGDPEPDPNPN